MEGNTVFPCEFVVGKWKEMDFSLVNKNVEYFIIDLTEIFHGNDLPMKMGKLPLSGEQMIDIAYNVG